jgi:hypothetical protein
MMSLAYYCFLRIGEIAVKNRQDTQKVIQINDVHFEEGTDKTTVSLIKALPLWLRT